MRQSCRKLFFFHNANLCDITARLVLKSFTEEIKRNVNSSPDYKLG